MYKNKTIILANGAFPKSKELLEILTIKNIISTKKPIFKPLSATILLFITPRFLSTYNVVPITSAVKENNK